MDQERGSAKDPALVSAEPDLRFAFDEIELAAIGDFLVIAGPPKERACYGRGSAAVIVDDLAAVIAELTTTGGEITTAEATSPTGRYLYARHAGEAEIEYVEWVPELVDRTIDSRAVRRCGGGRPAPTAPPVSRTDQATGPAKGPSALNTRLAKRSAIRR